MEATFNEPYIVRLLRTDFFRKGSRRRRGIVRHLRRRNRIERRRECHALLKEYRVFGG
jgi:hypothetical protein